MSLGLLFAVVSAFLFGSYLFVIKRYFSAYPATVYVFLAFAFALVWYVPVALVTVDGSFFPAGFGRTGVLVLATTVGFTLVGNLTFFRAIAVGAVSYVAPISKVIPVFVLPLEVLLLDQYLSALQVVGVVVATIAIYVANYRPGELLEPLQRAVSARPAQFALASAASFAVVDVGKRTLMQELAVPPQTFVVVLFATLTASLAPIAARNWPSAALDRSSTVTDGGTAATAEPVRVDVRGDLPKFAATGLLLATANHVAMYAFGALPASVASPIVNTQAVVAVVLGGLLLGEEHFRIRLVAAGLAVVGVTVIALG
ncbi:DMT family transporter [Halobacteria archaeon HArc-gm2]|nr:DMT family transporter [Halobacteria archaeon HArc-gm2]